MKAEYQIQIIKLAVMQLMNHTSDSDFDDSDIKLLKLQVDRLKSLIRNVEGIKCSHDIVDDDGICDRCTLKVMDAASKGDGGVK